MIVHIIVEAAHTDVQQAQELIDKLSPEVPIKISCGTFKDFTDIVIGLKNQKQSIQWDHYLPTYPPPPTRR